MAVAVVQISSEVTVTAGTSGNVTLTGVGAGNLLVVVHCQPVTGIRTFTYSDDKANTWAIAIAPGGNGNNSQISYAKNVAAGDTTITGTVDSSTSTWRFKVIEISGADTTTPLDQVSNLLEGVAANSHTSSADATVIDTAADVIVICAGILNSTGTATAADGAYTKIASGLDTRILWQYKISAGALTNEQGAWTHTGTARTGNSVIASFKGAPAGGNRRRRVLLGAAR